MRTSGCVYTSSPTGRTGALYTGVTSDLRARISQHRAGSTPGFATRYGIKRLVWYEAHWEIEAAIIRETQIKRWNRSWKIEMIETMNPDWDDLAVNEFGFEPIARNAHQVSTPGDGFPLSRE